MMLKNLLLRKSMKNNVSKDMWEIHCIYFYIIFMFLLSAFMVMRVYPFIGLADGFNRWKMAIDFLQSRRIINDTVLSPVIPLLQAITYRLSGSYALFTMIQTVIFYLCIGIMPYFLCSKKSICIGRRNVYIWIMVSLFVLLLPTVYIFPLLLTDSALCFCALVIMAISFYNIWINRNVFIWSIIIFISTIFTVSLRVNTITVSLGLALLGLILFKKLKKLVSGLLIISTLLAILFSNSFLENKFHAETFGMLWELTSIAKNGNDNKLYNDLIEIGDIDKAIEIYSDDYSNNIIWDNNPPFPAFVVSKGEKVNKIRKLYLNTVIDNPKQFLKNKIHFIDRALGVTTPLLNPARGIHFVDVPTKSYGAMDTPMSKSVRTKFIDFTTQIELITLRPYIMFIIILILMIIKYFIRKKHNMKILVMYVVACLYYTGFLLNIQAYEFRYFAPSFFMLLVLGAYIIIDIGSIFVKSKKYEKLRR